MMQRPSADPRSRPPSRSRASARPHFAPRRAPRLAPDLALALGLLGLLLPTSGARAAKLSHETLESGGAERTYVLYVPPKLDLSTPVPLLLALHGSGRDGKVAVQPWTFLARREGFLVAGPESEVSDLWAAPGDGPQFLLDVVKELEAKFDIDPRRIYLFGHSAGGHFALQMGLLEARRFAAVAVHAGAVRDGDFWLYERARRKIPILLIGGTEDRVVPILSVRRTHQQLADHGFPTELWEMERHDHWYYDLAGIINKRAWEFLQQYRLPEPQP